MKYKTDKKFTRALSSKEHNIETEHELIEAFTNIVEFKDDYSKGHLYRVAQYTKIIARGLGLSEKAQDNYYLSGILHDIGKVMTPSRILSKPGKLTDEEFEIIKQHTKLGYAILSSIKSMPNLAIGALYHHERWDGKGYLEGLAGRDIPRIARVIAVADCFDAMYSDRPYRNRLEFNKVIQIIREVRGTQLDPDIVDVFLDSVHREEIEQIALNNYWKV